MSERGGRPYYQTFETPPDVVKTAYDVLRVAAATGRVKRGTNETTKAVERGLAKLVFIATDVRPPEIVAHLPPLCEGRKVAYLFMPSKEELGRAAGIEVAAASVAIIEPGDAEKEVEELIKIANELRSKAGVKAE